MTEYKKILAAIDLTEESDQVIERARSLANLYNCSLDIVHVIEPLGYAYGGDIPMDLTEVQQQLEDHAKHYLVEAGKTYQVAVDQQHVIIGRPETEIHRLSEDSNFDLVVVGSHGRHGIQLLLGSTANGILHGAKCDVLAVRIH
ncbi:universal stress protein [Alkalimarinus sediminis]|uniref:Universal stress protein n=1 Tax=Alkalimarinus sediminis TaxID=1632866 RepID=A0A9E8HJM9_9ALTE|nr:universal stress protein [Alkalimarinus sediminis]UZW75913.1 universal stress protein [Alkalimarinus sediminis]